MYVISVIFFFTGHGDHRDLHVLTHSFPTRRSSELVAAARIGARTFWARPIAALCAGFLADRYTATRSLVFGFVLLGAGAAVLGTDLLPLQIPALFVILLAATSLGIYGVRGIYFSVMNEMRLPLAITGSAVGLVSVIGFTPELGRAPV